MITNPGLQRKVLWVLQAMNLNKGDIVTSRKLYLEVKYYANKGKVDLSELKEYKSDTSKDTSLVKCCEFVLQNLAQNGMLKKQAADRYKLQEPGKPNIQYEVVKPTAQIRNIDTFMPNETRHTRKVAIDVFRIREQLRERGMLDE